MKLIVYPDPILTQVSSPVTEFGKGLEDFCADLYTFMKTSEGIGISAVQVGVPKRIIVMEVPGNAPHTFINPELRDITPQLPFIHSEGCLSVPGYYEDRERNDVILLSFENVIGFRTVQIFKGIEAFCIQHELDHLDGKLFIDDLSPLKKTRIHKKIQKELKRKQK